MNMKTRIWVLVAITGIGLAAAIAVFLWLILPRLESPAVSGIVGVLVGASTGVLGVISSLVLGIWKTSKESTERLKDRVSEHALELTRMDYDLRQRSLEVSGTPRQFLAPAKVYRTFYKTLMKLHSTGEWSDEALKLGLLNIFELGPKKKQGENEVNGEPANKSLNADS